MKPWSPYFTYKFSLIREMQKHYYHKLAGFTVYLSVESAAGIEQYQKRE
jgi:hypothetical protein